MKKKVINLVIDDFVYLVGKALCPNYSTVTYNCTDANVAKIFGQNISTMTF